MVKYSLYNAKRKSQNKKEREEKYDLWFSDLKDGGCDRIYNFIFDSNNNIREDIKYYKDPEIELTKKLTMLEEEKAKNDKDLEERKRELELVYNSKGWRFLENMRKMKGKILCKSIKKKKEE